jgi:choline-glycine betaine transporter
MLRRVCRFVVKRKYEKKGKITFAIRDGVLICFKIAAWWIQTLVNIALCKSKYRRKVMNVCRSNIVGLITQTRRLCSNVSDLTILLNNIRGITSYLTMNTLHVHYK